MMPPFAPLFTRRQSLRVPSRRRRGMILAICLITLPIALAAFLLVFARVDVATAESRRHQQRVQARLLAESALAVMQSEKGGKSVKGKIEGIGGYRATSAIVNGTAIITAEGRPNHATGLIPGTQPVKDAPRIIAEITARTAAPGPGIEILESRTFAEMPIATPASP